MIKIYNTLGRKLETFLPYDEKEIKMYVCGPTVYDRIHVGNARPIVFFDTVRRYLEYKGYKVAYVQNFTDIDDKIIAKAKLEKVTTKELARKYIDKYYEDTKELNIKLDGSKFPLVTANISKIIWMIEQLEAKGYAYQADGDIYFDVNKFEDYGKLSNQDLSNLVATERVGENSIKRSQLDFALWKKETDPEISWESPWGRGRPGWHIECSALISTYFDGCVDIHAGGHDLIFPHHENEIAQSEAANGFPLAKYWMHNGFVNVRSAKMSKSLGNVVHVEDILKEYSGNELRLFMLMTHYRKPISFSEAGMDAAKSGFDRIKQFNRRLQLAIDNVYSEKYPNIKNEIVEDEDKLLSAINFTIDRLRVNFIQCMNEDFNTAAAIGILFQAIKELNLKFDELGINITANVEKTAREVKAVLFSLLFILGIDINESAALLEKNTVLSEKVEQLIELRKEAREQKDWKKADEIRQELKSWGVKLKDLDSKTVWELE